jgi:hypothetical protein
MAIAQIPPRVLTQRVPLPLTRVVRVNVTEMTPHIIVRVPVMPLVHNANLHQPIHVLQIRVKMVQNVFPIFALQIIVGVFVVWELSNPIATRSRQYHLIAVRPRVFMVNVMVLQHSPIAIALLLMDFLNRIMDQRVQTRTPRVVPLHVKMGEFVTHIRVDPPPHIFVGVLRVLGVVGVNTPKSRARPIRVRMVQRVKTKAMVLIRVRVLRVIADLIVIRQ